MRVNTKRFGAYIKCRIEVLLFVCLWETIDWLFLRRSILSVFLRLRDCKCKRRQKY